MGIGKYVLSLYYGLAEESETRSSLSCHQSPDVGDLEQKSTDCDHLSCGAVVQSSPTTRRSVRNIEAP
jgi:hypothetical protein